MGTLLAGRRIGGCMASTDIYEKSALVIHGPLWRAQQKYSNADAGLGYTSHDGNPAFCMHLKISDFVRNTDRSVSCTVYTAALRALNPGGQSSFFGYPFDVYIALLIGDVADYGGNYAAMLAAIPPESKTHLFSKPASDARWGDYVYGLSGTTTLTCSDPKDKKAYVVVSILSICTCSQAGIDTPVYVDDISQYIPPGAEPYIWRMQHDKDPSVTTGPLGWHLVRPYYICKTIGGVKGWCSCEDITKLAYDADGHKIN